MQKIVLFWFRRDFRLTDNAGLYAALTSGATVLPLFIFDTAILDLLDDKSDRRVNFIHQQTVQIQNELNAMGSSLYVAHGQVLSVFQELIERYPVEAVYTNGDYEPQALKRDKQVEDFLASNGISFHVFKDQVIVEKSEVVKEDKSPYTVFTPYMKKWKALLHEKHLTPYPSEKHVEKFLKWRAEKIISLDELGFKPTLPAFLSPKLDSAVITNYHLTRDFPSVNGTSKMSLHLRFGTVSIRDLVKTALRLNEKWLNELIWREFYMMILFHFPYVAEGPFKKQYNRINWRNNEQEFQSWCEGKTGYPIVDAGMRELNETGFMHNRVRMIVASFLVKHLLIDWRWGEAYFAKKLMDFELSSNNGGWQWAASSGCDAAPYFRIFNPAEQTKKFDPQYNYIRKWVPEFEGLEYPLPIVEHKFARERVLKTYKASLTKDLV